jgi:DNA-binding MarR family transcriptional regulator
MHDLQNIPCTYYIRAIYHSIKHFGKLDNKKKPLNSSQQSILFLLASRPQKEMSLGQIKDELNLSQTGVAKLTTQLEERGCIEKFTDESDRRIKKVRLLKKGVNNCGRVSDDLFDMEETLLKGMSEADREKLNEYLSIMYHNSWDLDKRKP